MAFHKLESSEISDSYEEGIQEAMDEIDSRFDNIIPEQVTIIVRGISTTTTYSIENEQCGWVAYIGATSHEIAQDLVDMAS